MANVKNSKAKSNDIEVSTEVVKPIAKVRKDIPLTTLVECRNATKGKLIYISKRQLGYEIVWEDFGSVEYVELSELISMRNSSPRFFQDGWLIIDDTEIIDFLGIQKHYENIINIDDFDNLFQESPEVLEEKLTKMPKGFRDTVIMRAKELIGNGVLDSRKRIEVIEKVLNVDLSL